MQKQEIFALVDQLFLDQEKYNKFIEYTESFVAHPRCKKGGLAFIEEVFNLPEIEGKDELAISLLTEKTSKNSYAIDRFIMVHPITTGYNQALADARKLVMSKIGEYIIYTAKRIHETNLEDKVERQVYLRRAVARLFSLFTSSLTTSVSLEQWAEIEPYQWCDYLTTTLDELVNSIDLNRYFMWSNDLNNLNLLKSLNTYLDYLDTFVEF